MKYKAHLVQHYLHFQFKELKCLDMKVKKMIKERAIKKKVQEYVTPLKNVGKKD
jgi:hypothetical protein